MNYSPQGKPAAVCKPGDFPFAAVGLDHGHIYHQCSGLIEAGGGLEAGSTIPTRRSSQFLAGFPERQSRQRARTKSWKIPKSGSLPPPPSRASAGRSACASWTREKITSPTRPRLPPSANSKPRERKRRQPGGNTWCTYSERLHVECAVFAGQLIREGAIGRVLQVLGLGPHRLQAATRPAWFFEREKYGGILCDIGSHQIEQFLSFSGATDARVAYSAVANYAHRDYPELEDFGEANLVADNGASSYFRVDWFTPDGLRTWGDGRTLHPRHEGYDRAAQVHRRRPRRGGRPGLPRQQPRGSSISRSTARSAIPSSASSSWTA